MAYHKKWRRQNAELLAMALSSSDSEDYSFVSARAGVCATINFENSLREDCAGSTADSNLENLDLDDQQYSSESDDTETGSSSDEISDLRSDMAKWAVRNKATRTSVDELLSLLRKHGHRLPKDARTLLGTPRHVDAQDLCGGQYLYFGLESGLLKICSQYQEKIMSRENHVLLNFNIDGLPLFKSSNVQIWPILCSVKRFQPFVVAVFCGNGKPNSVRDFMSEFLEELTTLQHDGISFKGETLNVKVNAFICDAPARAFLKCIKGHNAYNSCERCTIEGNYMNHRVVFNYQPQEKILSRTEEEFSSLSYPFHQNGLSPLVDAGLSCIQSFVLDYMHLVCLGVVRCLLVFLKQGPRECKISQRQIREISSKLESLNGKLPREFARQPRSLASLERWKATEFRQFLLYTEPVVLRDVLPDSFYHHFLTLTVAMSILLDADDDTRKAYTAYAEELLMHFYKTSTKLYSPVFPSYNVHSLIHLAADVRHFGTSLNEICAFPFENHLHKLKKSVRNATNPISQLSKRITEMDNAKVHTIPAPHRASVSTKMKDSCFMVGDGFAFVKEKRSDKMCVCDFFHLDSLESFFDSPCDSKLINIARLRDERRSGKRKLIEQKELKKKVVCLPYGNGFVLIPMLHGSERH